MGRFLLDSRGYTLIEMLFVIAIIGILATIMVFSMQSVREKAKIARSQTELVQIFNAFTILEDDTGQWPGHKIPSEVEMAPDNEICADGCTYGLTDCRSGIICDDVGNPYPDWKGPYMTPMPIDPWGNEYFFDTDYIYAGDNYAVIGSYGPDEIGNGLYNADDILFFLVKQ